jgi:predicted acyltransferase
MQIGRNQSLDVLRGAAILLMVLCSSIAFGKVLPAWMFHAQTPPPYHLFNPEIPGITWVDLVFPLFLFSMGAAIPLSLKKKTDEVAFYKIALQLGARLILLAFFAIFTLHARAWVMDKQPTLFTYLISIGGFILLFLMYGNWSAYLKKYNALAIKLIAFVIACVFLYTYPFAYGKFSLAKSDVIILVLANMAFFGGLIWYFTRNQPLVRLGVLPFIMAVFLGAKEIDSINSLIFNWSPASWLYQFYYLKYLFIIIPGTLAGDWFLKEHKQAELIKETSKGTFILIACIATGLIVVNLWGLFTRALMVNLLINGIGCVVLYVLAQRIKAGNSIKHLIYAGIYLIMLGLFFEAYEGGIKKDYSTYSYYFVCSGLSFFALLSFTIIERLGYFKGLMSFLAANGKNPMIAYTVGNLGLIPLLKITTLSVYLDAMSTTALNGFARGLIFTGAVALITTFFTRIKFFWKT